MERNKTMKGPAGQRGALALAAALAILLLSTIAAVAWTKSVGALSGSGAQSATGDRLEDAAKAGVEWARVQARSERCQASSTFTGANAIPGHQDATVTVACNKVANGATTVYEVVSTACTESSCPSAVPPAGYAEKTARAQFPVVPVAASTLYKEALVEWLLRHSPVRLYDFEENFLELSTSGGPDPYYPALWLRMEGSNGGTSFTDSSTYAKSIARTGSVVTSNASFSSGSSSAMFPGASSSWLTIAASPDFDLSSGDATIEFMAKPYLPRGSNWNRVLAAGSNGSMASWQVYFLADGSIGFGVEYSPVNGVTCGAGTIKSGKWQAIAVTVSGTTATIFVDGVACGTQTALTRPTAGSIPLYVGLDASLGIAAGQVPYQGFVDDVTVTRSVKWFSNYAPPMSPDGVSLANSLFLHFDGPNGGTDMPDSSAYRRPVSLTGSPALSTASSAYGGSSLYLNGSSDVRVDGSGWTNFGSSDFSIAFSFRSTNTNNYAGMMTRNSCGTNCRGVGDWDIFLQGGATNGQPQIWWNDYSGGAPFMVSGTTGFNDGAWHRFEWTRRGSNHYMIIDGVVRATASSGIAMGAPANSTVSIGNDFAYGGRSVTGWFDEVQIVSSASPRNADFSLPAVSDANDDARVLQLDFEGADGSASFTDSSAASRPVTAYGSPRLTKNQFADGATSGRFDGSSRLTVPASADLALGTSDFTIHGWAMFSAGSMGREACIYDGGTGGPLVCKSAQDKLYIAQQAHTVSYNTGPTVQAGVWTHFAWTRAGGTNRLFVSGTAAFSTYDLFSLAASDAATIGARQGGASNIEGYLDDLRVIRGKALWTANFTPPGGPLAASGAKTTLLLHLDEADGSQAFSDASPSAKVVASSGATATRSSARMGAGSADFSAGQITVAASADFDFGAGDFTVDLNVKPNDGAADAILAGYGWTGSGTAPWALTRRGSDGAVLFYASNGASWNIANAASAGAAPSGAWTHVAVTRKSGTFYLANNGKIVSTLSSAAAIGASSGPLSIGGPSSGSLMRLSGLIDEVRIVKGQAAWTADFPPPLRAYNADGSWTAALVFDKAKGRNGASTAWFSPVTADSVSGFSFSTGAWIDVPALRSDELAGASVVALARPDSSTANTSSSWQRMFDAAMADGSMRGWIGLTHADASTGFAAGTGDATGLWDAAASASKAFSPDAWGLFGASTASSGSVSLYNGGVAAGSKASYALPSVDRTMARIANGSYGSSQFTGMLGAVAVFGVPLSAAQQQAMATGLTSGALPPELRFRSDDRTVTDRAGHTLTASSLVTADASGQGAGPAWVMPGTTGQRLTLTNADVSPGSSDFELDAWIRPSTYAAPSGWVSIFDLGTDGTRADGITLYLKSDGRLASWTAGADAIVTSFKPPIGKWSKVTLARRSGQLTVSLNGSSSQAASVPASLGSKTLNIGSANANNDPSSGAAFTGSMRNVRVWIGAAP